MSFLGFLRVFSAIIRFMLTHFGAIVEILYCNIIRQPKICGAYKACSLLFRKVWIDVLGTWVPIDFNYLLCIQGLGLSGWLCAYYCDFCPIYLFGLETPADPFFRIANLAHKLPEYAPLAYTTCNLSAPDGCCNVNDSILNIIFAFFPWLG